MRVANKVSEPSPSQQHNLKVTNLSWILLWSQNVLTWEKKIKNNKKHKKVGGEKTWKPPPQNIVEIMRQLPHHHNWGKKHQWIALHCFLLNKSPFFSIILRHWRRVETRVRGDRMEMLKLSDLLMIFCV